MPEYRASFRVMKRDLEPQEVSCMLELTPDSFHRKGDPRIGKSGRRYSDFSEGLWELKSGLEMGAPLAAHLAKLAETLGGHGAALDRLRDLGYEMDIFVGVFDEGGNTTFTLESEDMETLSALRLGIVFDVYP